MNTDQGVIFVLLEHFSRHLHPRALEIEEKLNAGKRLDDWEIADVNQVLENMKALRPLIERHPEHKELVARVVSLYSGIARRARQNEASAADAREAP